MAGYNAGYSGDDAVEGGNLNWDLGLERVTNGTGTIGTESTTTAITIGQTGITTTFPGAVTITQTLTTSGIISIAAGSAAAPSLTFTGDTDLGLYRSAADILGFTAAGASIGTWSATALVVTQAVATSGSPTAVTITGGAHTTLAASTEATDVLFDLARTVQFATGALTTQRAVQIEAPTYGFVGASTLTNATTLDVLAAPTAGTNATVTNTRVVRLAGDVTIGATAASMTYSVIDIPAHTVTVTGTTQVTSASMAAAVRLGAITITDASAVTIDTAATLYIAGPPAAGGSVTLSATWAIIADAGNVRIDGQATMGGSTAPVATLDLYHDSGVRQPIRMYNASGANWAIGDGISAVNSLTIFDATNSRVGLTIGTTASSTTTFNGSSIAVAWVCNMSTATFTQVAASSGAPTALTVTGAAHTSMTASTEDVGVNLNMSATKQWATGALTTQREVLIQAPTFGFVGASTLTNATTFDITAAPTAGTNATFTNTRLMRLAGAVTIGATSASMTYSVIDIPAHTVTVSGTTQVTSTSMASAVRLGIITITDGDAVTVDTASTLYIAGAPLQAGSVTLTSPYAIHVDAGRSRFDDSVLIGATTVGTNSPTNLLVVASGTVPTSSPADSVTFYSTDNSAGNTIPSFYCEGTEVIATGQADSASSVRVRMRINGTVATFLCI